MFSARLTALSSALSFIAGAVLIICIWSYVERGEQIATQKQALADRKKVTDVVQDRADNEEKVTNEKEKRIKRLGQTGRNTPMSPAVRAAIDSLHR